MGRGNQTTQMVADQEVTPPGEHKGHHHLDTRGVSSILLQFSIYKAQFRGFTKSSFRKLIWATWAPARLIFFTWLLMRNRLWCNDRLQRRGWPNGCFCQLCLRNLESTVHLFSQCTRALAVWTHSSARKGCASLHPSAWNERTK